MFYDLQVKSRRLHRFSSKGFVLVAVLHNADVISGNWPRDSVQLHVRTIPVALGACPCPPFAYPGLDVSKSKSKWRPREVADILPAPM